MDSFQFFKKSYFKCIFFMCVVCAPCECKLPVEARVGFTGCYGLPDMGTWNQTQIFYRSSKCSQFMSHLFKSTDFFFFLIAQTGIELTVMHKSQRTACGNWFSPSIQVLEELNSRCQAWQQVTKGSKKVFKVQEDVLRLVNTSYEGFIFL